MGEHGSPSSEVSKESTMNGDSSPSSPTKAAHKKVPRIGDKFQLSIPSFVAPTSTHYVPSQSSAGGGGMRKNPFAPSSSSSSTLPSTSTSTSSSSLKVPKSSHQHSHMPASPARRRGRPLSSSVGGGGSGGGRKGGGSDSPMSSRHSVVTREFLDGEPHQELNRNKESCEIDWRSFGNPRKPEIRWIPGKLPGKLVEHYLDFVREMFCSAASMEHPDDARRHFCRERALYFLHRCDYNYEMAKEMLTMKEAAVREIRNETGYEEEDEEPLDEGDQCFMCGDGGSLLLCDHKDCRRVYHLACIGMNEIPPDTWECPSHFCHKCENAADPAYRCSYCYRSYCKVHVPEELASKNKTEFLCAQCDAETLSSKQRFFTRYHKMLRRKREFHMTKVTKIAGVEIDQWRLYQYVVKLGGMKRVNDSHSWGRIKEMFRMPATSTTANSQLRKHYRRTLYFYEQLHYPKSLKLDDDVNGGGPNASITDGMRRQSSRLMLGRGGGANASADMHHNAAREPSPDPERVVTRCVVIESHEYHYLVEINVGGRIRHGFVFKPHAMPTSVTSAIAVPKIADSKAAHRGGGGGASRHVTRIKGEVVPDHPSASAPTMMNGVGDAAYGGGSTAYASSLNGSSGYSRANPFGQAHSDGTAASSAAAAAVIPKLEAHPPYGSGGAYAHATTFDHPGAVDVTSPLMQGGRVPTKHESPELNGSASTKRPYTKSATAGGNGGAQPGTTPTKKKRQKRSRSQQGANGSGKRGKHIGSGGASDVEDGRSSGSNNKNNRKRPFIPRAPRESLPLFPSRMVPHLDLITNVKIALRTKKMTQTQLGRIVEVPQEIISQFLNNKKVAPTRNMPQKLGDWFDSLTDDEIAVVRAVKVRHNFDPQNGRFGDDTDGDMGAGIGGVSHPPKPTSRSSTPVPRLTPLAPSAVPLTATASAPVTPVSAASTPTKSKGGDVVKKAADADVDADVDADAAATSMAPVAVAEPGAAAPGAAADAGDANGAALRRPRRAAAAGAAAATSAHVANAASMDDEQFPRKRDEDDEDDMNDTEDEDDENERLQGDDDDDDERGEGDADDTQSKHKQTGRRGGGRKRKSPLPEHRAARGDAATAAECGTGEAMSDTEASDTGGVGEGEVGGEKSAAKTAGSGEKKRGGRPKKRRMVS